MCTHMRDSVFVYASKKIERIPPFIYKSYNNNNSYYYIKRFSPYYFSNLTLSFNLTFL